MKSILYAAIFLLGSSTATALFYRPYEWIIVILSTIVGFLFGRMSDLERDIKSLRSALAADWEKREKSQTTTAKTAVVGQAELKAKNYAPDPTSAVLKESDEAPQMIPPASIKPTATSEPIQKTSKAREPSSVDKLIGMIKNYFTGGNLFVRVGILILFFGVSFLLKYASDAGVFPIEYRLMSVAVSAIALLLFGWRLRQTKQAYGLLLQGAGVGILYLDIFAAFSLYQLIPPLPAFALMFVVSMFAAALAVLQDSRSLAILGFTGGFLAPILASTGSNNYVGLFSYYVLLNIAIVVIAWFKAWRELNLLGFFFTFVVGTVWGVQKYVPENFATVEPFLILFFLFYVLIAVLFALRQPAKLRGYVDGSLLFGVPLAASGLQYGLVKDFEYGISISSFAMGAFYLTLAWALWKRAGDGLKLLSEAFLALGVIFASLAIPFALAPTHTAAAWGLEGLGLMWLGSRQNRLSVRFFGLLLQFGAGVFVIFGVVSLIGHGARVELPFINASFISAMMMAIAGILSARLLSVNFQGRRAWEKPLSIILLIWGLVWLFGGVLSQVLRYYDDKWLEMACLLLASAVSLVFMVTALRTKPQWSQAWIVSLGLLAVMVLVAVTQFNGVLFNPYLDHPFRDGGWLAWPIAFAVMYAVIFQIDKQQLYGRSRDVIHSMTGLLFVALLTWQGMNQLLVFVPAESGWAKLWLAVPATTALWLIVKANFWPVSANRNVYQQQTGMVLAGYLILWGLLAVVARGNSAPLPWIPLLNPLDITLAIVLLTLFTWWKSISHEEIMTNISQYKPNKSMFAIAIAGLTFMWLNFTLFRIATHWFDVPYSANGLYNSSLVQTAVSLLWALSGVILTIFASKKNMRTVWIAGGILLGVVVLKLFTIDLSTLSNISRIISFIVVGLLLTSIGYFAPLPDAESKQEKRKTDDKKEADSHD